MKTTAFDKEIATEVENAVMDVYNCRRCDIVQFVDSDVKKVVVFILYHHFGFNWHLIGKAYQMTFLYVPTVAEQMLFWYKNDPGVKGKIDLILIKIATYETLLEAV